MNIDLYPEFYNDVFGPVMQPGSSSHTAGPCRLGYLAGGLFLGYSNQPTSIRPVRTANLTSSAVEWIFSLFMTRSRWRATVL